MKQAFDILLILVTVLGAVSARPHAHHPPKFTSTFPPSSSYWCNEGSYEVTWKGGGGVYDLNLVVTYESVPGNTVRPFGPDAYHQWTLTDASFGRCTSCILIPRRNRPPSIQTPMFKDSRPMLSSQYPFHL